MGQKVVFDYQDVLKLKQNAAQKFSEPIHFHDSCAGQYFSLDNKNDELKKFITQYYSDLNMRAVFSEDGMQFTVEKGMPC